MYFIIYTKEKNINNKLDYFTFKYVTDNSTAGDIDFLDEKTKRNFFKHKLWFECSKSKNESCINHECKYNFIRMHNSELYGELMQEIQDEWIN